MPKCRECRYLIGKRRSVGIECMQTDNQKKWNAGRKNIDHGKIVALNKAGWSTAKIADELGTTSVTVRNHLKREETA